MKKALAKVSRGYDNLKYLSYFELYQVLTGFPIINFKKIYKNIDNNNMIKMLEYLKNDNEPELQNYTTNFKFVVNSIYFNKAIKFENKDDIINKYLFYNNNNNNNKPIQSSISYSNVYSGYNGENKPNINKSIEEEYTQQNKISYNNDIFMKIHI